MPLKRLGARKSKRNAERIFQIVKQTARLIAKTHDRGNADVKSSGDFSSSEKADDERYFYKEKYPQRFDVRIS